MSEKKATKKITSEKIVETPLKKISSTDEKSKRSMLEKIKEKAKLLEKSVSQKHDDSDLKKIIKPDEEEKPETLVPIESYLKSSIHLGTRVITPDMKRFVYKRRADGLAVFDTTILDKKIKESAEFISGYRPEDIIIVCKREAGWKPVDLFSQVTGINSFTKKYPAGILTNSNLSNFLETELIIICDPWIDKNALNDSLKIKIPVLAICDTNNYTQGVTHILPGNNKSAKSLGMILYLLAKLYSEKRKTKAKIPEIQEWVDNWENLEPPK